MPGSISDIVATGQNVVTAINNLVSKLSSVAENVTVTLSSNSLALLPSYETGPWTPNVTFATSGDAVFTYTTQIGRYTKIGGLTFVFFAISGNLTFSTSLSSGVLEIEGLPFAVGGANPSYQGSLDFNTILMSTTGYTQFVPEAVTGTSQLQFVANGQTLGRVFVTSTNISTVAVGIVWRGTVPYVTA